jgi:hypothetical protein
MLVAERTAATVGRSFDSLSYAKRMESVGFTRQQAEALAEEQGKLIDERLATKTDLAEITTQLEAKIEALRLSTKTDLAETKADLIKWVVGMGVAQVAMIVTMLKLHI